MSCVNPAYLQPDQSSQTYRLSACAQYILLTDPSVVLNNRDTDGIMDPSAPLTVGVNTLLTCEFVLPAPHTYTGVADTYAMAAVATGTIAGAYGLFKGYNQPGPMITAAGINGGIAGATFFSTSVHSLCHTKSRLT